MIHKFIHRFFQLFRQNKKKASVRLEVALHFERGIIFGQIYSITLRGFQMITACDCNDLNTSPTSSLVDIDGKYFSALISKVGNGHLNGTFDDAITDQDFDELLKTPQK